MGMTEFEAGEEATHLALRLYEGSEHPLSCRCQLCLTVRAIARDQSEKLNVRRGFEAAMRQVHSKLRTYAQSDHDLESCKCDLCQTVRSLFDGLTLDQREAILRRGRRRGRPPKLDGRTKMGRAAARIRTAAPTNWPARKSRRG